MTSQTLSGSRSLVLAAALGAALALAVLYVILAAPVHAPPPPAALSRLVLAKNPEPAPAVAFQDAFGQRHSLSAFKGHYVLLNLWATWCAPCVRELPALAKLSRVIPPRSLAVIAVDVGRGGAGEAREFLSEHGAGALTVYVDSDIALVRAFHAYGLPLTVLIDPKGREIARAEGGQDWAAPDSVAYLKRIANGE